MGILADIFISNNEEALNYQSSQLGDRTQHINKYNPAELRNLTDLDFSTLWSLLENEEWDIDKHKLEKIEFAPDGESWLFKFPDTFCNLLTSLDSTSSKPFAELWAQSEELEISGWSSSETQEVILTLVNSSKEAASKKLGLYLSGSV